MKYQEDFDDGPGGWFGWVSNSRGPKELEVIPDNRLPTRNDRWHWVIRF